MTESWDDDGTYRTFLLTRPSRDVTFSESCASGFAAFLLTRPSRDVTSDFAWLTIATAISTHTSLAGRDGLAISCIFGSVISTHTSLAGRDDQHIGQGERQPGFLLTRPSRDVTAIWTEMCGAINISTHTSLAGRDAIQTALCVALRLFLLTRPSRDVTTTAQDRAGSRLISTHTSLAGRDGRRGSSTGLF